MQKTHYRIEPPPSVAATAQPHYITAVLKPPNKKLKNFFIRYFIGVFYDSGKSET